MQMKIKSVFVILFSVSLVFLSGCVTNPIVNVSDQSVVTNNPNYTEADVKKAIIRAGAGLGWNMNADKPGHILATLHLRTHMAQVDINYNKQKYSITYKDSENLDYDGKNIHRNYNGWIQNLDKAIKVQLNTL
jgi:hypothetical protein